MIAVGYGWLYDLVLRAAGLAFDEKQLETAAQLAERKLVDLFDVAKQNALANGRERIFLHDLPLTKGLRRTMQETALLAKDLDVDPAGVFLAQIRASDTIDEMVRAELPRLTAVMLVLTSRIVATVDPSELPPDEVLRLITRQRPHHPTAWELERAARVLDLAL